MPINYNFFVNYAYQPYDPYPMFKTYQKNNICYDYINDDKRFFSVAKRTFDVIFAALLLILTLPLLLVVAAAIRATSNAEESILFKQKRIGLNGHPFTIYKFRTMRKDTPELSTSMIAEPSMYITKLGAFLRRTSIDELPQLINVLLGDMSVVGPRPLIKGESDIHEKRMRNGVYDVRPGITGWAQVNGRDCISNDEKIYYDTQYVINRSIAVDVYILLKTCFSVFSGDGYCEGNKQIR